jgi:phosphoribosylamine---glycine ligase
LNILVVGSGGREHAIAWRCAEEGHKVYCAPGNPGIAKVAECIALSQQTPERFLEVANLIDADLTIVGPEAPLVAGIADLFEQHGRKIFGPRQHAAQLEGSKAFAKEFMARHGIPTARFVICEKLEDAKAALPRFELPVVLKADGLAAGKGVVIAKSRDEAERTLEAMFSGELVGEAGSRVVIEDFWRGEEVSFIAICDGERAVAFPPTQDHKAAYENDEGPNTGGMGAYSDDRILTPEERARIMDQVILPTLRGMKSEGQEFRGFLFAGLMMTSEGIQTLEFNARMGDPETQCILMRVEGGFVETVMAAVESRLDPDLLQVRGGASACLVMAAYGYPGKVRNGDEITGIEEAEALGAKVFEAGTKLSEKRKVTSGGRVLGVTASAAALPEALRQAYAALEHVRFDGMHFRRDIGKKGLKRYTD